MMYILTSENPHRSVHLKTHANGKAYAAPVLPEANHSPVNAQTSPLPGAAPAVSDLINPEFTAQPIKPMIVGAYFRLAECYASRILDPDKSNPNQGTFQWRSPQLHNTPENKFTKGQKA
jgi:hypothetical protein